MGRQPTITSTRNPRVVAARKLALRKQRREQGAFLVEGLQLLHMALDAGARPSEVFFCVEQIASDQGLALLERSRLAGADVIPVADHVLRVLSEREGPQGLVARFPLFYTALRDLTLSGVELVIALDRLRDPGNIGTLIRTADAAGAAAVVLIEPSADPFDPKAIRSSMGSLFNVPVCATDDAASLFGALREAGLTIIGADLGGQLAWEADVWQRGIALVLGQEGPGLSSDVRAEMDARVGLPMRGGAESLNVAVAGGILAYQWVRAHPMPNDRSASWRRAEPRV